MRCRLSISCLALVACGAPDATDDTQPAAQIRSVSCTIVGSSTVDVAVATNVTLPNGAGLDAEINVSGPDSGTQSLVESYDCGEWQQLFRGSEDAGCERTSLTQAASLSVMIDHNETFNSPLTVDNTFVVVVLNVRKPPLDDLTTLAQDLLNVQCVP